MKTFRDDAIRCLDEASGLGEDRVRSLLEEAQPQHGEFALPCFQLAKERRMPPPKIAAEIAEAAKPMGRIAEPEEIAAMIHFLASNDCGFINGQAIAVDGGFTAGMSINAYNTLAAE